MAHGGEAHDEIRAAPVAVQQHAQGSTGGAARRSISTNAAIRAAPAASTTIVAVSPQPSVCARVKS